jgi:hypothetical protein
MKDFDLKIVITVVEIRKFLYGLHDEKVKTHLRVLLRSLGVIGIFGSYEEYWDVLEDF